MFDVRQKKASSNGAPRLAPPARLSGKRSNVSLWDGVR